jgi:hypothetical protein
MKRLGYLLGLVACLAGFARQSTSIGTPLEWRSSCPSLEIGAVAPDGPSIEELGADVQEAIATWEGAGCKQLPFDLRDVASRVSTAEYDAHNIVVTRPADYCLDPANRELAFCLNPSVLATTTLYWIDRPGDPRDGEILEIDLEINLRHPFAGAGAYDLQSIITHELGHMIGLEHSCTDVVDERNFDPAGHALPLCSAQAAAGDLPVMFPIVKPAEQRRDLAADELNAICAIYNTRPIQCDDSLHAGCDAGGDASLALVPILLLLLSTRRKP